MGFWSFSRVSRWYKRLIMIFAFWRKKKLNGNPTVGKVAMTCKHTGIKHNGGLIIGHWHALDRMIKPLARLSHSHLNMIMDLNVFTPNFHRYNLYLDVIIGCINGHFVNCDVIKWNILLLSFQLWYFKKKKKKQQHTLKMFVKNILMQSQL